jgi:hypothetical protein
MATKNKTYFTKYAGIGDQDIWSRTNLLTRQYDRYEQYWGPEIEAAVRNARMYWHVNFGQWPWYVVEKLRSQGRRPPTYPIIPDKIETLVGSFMANGFDMKYEPMNGKHTSLTMKLQDMYLSDKFNLDWESSEIMCLLDSHIKVGYERMTVSDMIDPFGNIGWEHLNPRHVYLDPSWKSIYTRDLMNYFLWEHLTVAEIKRIFPKSSQRLDVAFDRELREGVDYGYNYGAVPRWKSIEEKWTGRHKVIEYHHIVLTDRMYEWDKVNNCWFPESGFRSGSEEDRQVKLEYVKMNGLGVDDICNLKQKKRTKFIEVICPDIDKELFLDKGKDIIQTDNVNIYPNGIRYNGQYQGIVDRLYDVQIAFNKGEMLIQDIFMRGAKGAFIMDKALTGGDPELERQIEMAWNDPAARIWVDEFATERLPQGGIIPLPGTNVPPDAFRLNDRYADMADRFSKVPAAADSRTESGKESGKLFRYKLEVGMIGQKYLSKNYERQKRDKTEAYAKQAKITYSGVPRMFGKSDGKNVFTLNQEAVDRFTGQKVIIDDISTLPQMKVIIYPSKAGTTMRNQIRETSSELMGYTEDPLIHAIFMSHIAQSSELGEEEKEEAKKAFDLIKMEAAMMKAVNIQDMGMRLQKGQEKEDAMNQKLGLPPGAGQAQQQDEPEQQVTYGQNEEKDMFAGTEQEKMLFNNQIPKEV